MKAPHAIVIAGPTASGKSAVALRTAERLGGTIVNADSMQVYKELRILTARPTAADEARAPHLLYGHVAASDAYSAGRFVADVDRVLPDIRAAGRIPIVVGGTGLYLRAILEGLSPIPAVPDEIRDRWRLAAGEQGAAVLHGRLAARDPEMAARLAPTDTQRIVRALEVIEATGQSILHWQAMPGTPLFDPKSCVLIVLRPPRAELHRRVEDRFDAMIRAGALAEVENLRTLGLDDDLPAMRAVGVPPLLAHLAGRLGLADAIAMAKADTRRYVKRQETWLSRNMISWITHVPQFSERDSDIIGNIIESAVDELRRGA